MHYFLIVVYERSVLEVEAVKSLSSYYLTNNLNEFSVIIWDNSLLKKSEADVVISCGLRSVKYIYENENKSLSELYNKTLSEFFSHSECSSITILDQDSVLDSDFIESCILFKGEVLGAPKVISNKSAKVVSPRYHSHNNFRRHTVIKKIQHLTNGILPSKNFFALGSGLTIPKAVWNSGLRFDEKLSFYGVDEEFCYDYSGKFSEFLLMKGTIVHDISDESIDELGHSYWKFSKYMDHWRYRLVKYESLPRIFAYSVYLYWILKFHVRRVFKKCTSK